MKEARFFIDSLTELIELRVDSAFSLGQNAELPFMADAMAQKRAVESV